MASRSERMPAVFLGHGTPWNTLETNRYTNTWRAFGASVRPRAIVVFSAHWYVAGTRVTGAAHPRTVHDFSGARPPLRTFQYPAPGDPLLAERVRALLAPLAVESDERWGFDHGAWSVLAHAFPAADIPTIEVALDRTQPPAFHFALAQRLAPLRDEGVLILGSGNVIHNIEVARHPWPDAPTDWQATFMAAFHARLQAREHAALIDYLALPNGPIAASTPDHYLPILSVLGASRPDDELDIFVDGEEGSALGMLSFAFR
jgi:4,5-DOPA dioxygenase extradiol